MGYAPTTSNQQQFDLLSGIQGYVRDSIIKYSAKHVKGHQDDNVDLCTLDRLAILNIEVDFWAKDFWARKVEGHTYFKYKTPKGIWAISMLGTRVCKHLVQYLRESIEGGKAAEYWIYKKKRMTEEGYFQVDWEANKLAMKESRIARNNTGSQNSSQDGVGREQ